MARLKDKIAPISPQALIKEEAGTWIVKLDQGSLSGQQSAELQQWLMQSDFHREYLEKLAHNWDAMGILQELAELFPLSEQAAIKPKPTNPLIKRFKHWLSGTLDNLQKPPVWGSALASFMLIAVLITNLQPNHYETQIGQQASYQLPDGTTLILNTNSEVALDYSSERRVVRLLKGEAHFEVAKNPQRPFMVYAGEGMVWAVGTAFNVRYVGNQKQADNYIDVTVTEGTVKVFAQVNQEQFKEKQQPVETDKKAIEPAQSASAQSLNPENNAPPLKEQIVHAGKSVHYTSVIETIQLTSAEAVEQKLAWQQGAIIFSGETLEQAIQEIARYTERQLTIVDPAIKNIRVGGHYKTNDINGLLASLSQGFNIQVSYVNSQQIELSSKQLKKHQPIAPAEPHPVIPAEPHHPVIPSERSDEGSHQPKPKPKPKPKKNNKSPKPLRVNYATPVSNTCNTK